MNTRICQVFISHSAHRTEEPATQTFLNALVKAMKAVPGLEPQVDQKDLHPGDQWLQKLYTWMGLCNAAVIMLSPRAVTRENSAWVPREANLLLWRKALDPRFVVIPVLIGGLKPADLAGNPFLADVRLTDLQLAPGLTDKAKISKIVQGLRDKLGSGTARLAFDPLRVHVEDCLQRYAPTDSISATLTGHFGDDPWQPYLQPHQNLSHKMLRRAVHDTVDSVIVDVIQGSQGDTRLGVRLFEALFPMRLPAESAGRLLTLCRQQEGRGSVLVNSHDTWAVRMLLRTATGLPRDDMLRTWQIVEMPGDWVERDTVGIVPELARLLAEAVLGTNGWDELGDRADPQARLQEQMARLSRQLLDARRDTGVPLLVCAAYAPRWPALAAELVLRFPTVAFLFWTGDALPPGLPAGDDCVPLSPSWPVGSDHDWLLGYRRKHKQFGGNTT